MITTNPPKQENQKPFVLWLTGISGAGKSTIAGLMEDFLRSLGHSVYVLDGDKLRCGINKDLGFSDRDRHENVRRIAEVAKLMLDAGLTVIVACISPFQASREAARGLFSPGDFIEVFMDTPFEVARARDPKGLYKLAHAGMIPEFTGIDSRYEVPAEPEIRIISTLQSPRDSRDTLISGLRNLAVLPPEADAVKVPATLHVS